MFSIFIRLLTSPKLEDLQRKELESAQKELLAAQTARDYAEAMCSYHQARIDRLSHLEEPAGLTD